MSQPKPLPRLLLFLPLLLSAVLALLYWRGLTFDANRSPNRMLGKPLPSLSFPSLDDGSKILQTGDIKGPALINVWASWCGACRNEHKQLLEISHQYGVAIYGVDYQDEAAKAKDWLRQQGNPFVWVMFDGAMAAGLPLDVFSLPQTYVIDANGIIRARHIGEMNEAVWQNLRESIQPGLRNSADGRSINPAQSSVEEAK